MVGRFQQACPSRSRRGRLRSRSWSVRTTRTAVRRLRKVSNTSAMRAWTSRSGAFVTTPEASRTSPTRQRQSQLAALRLGQEARRQPAADRMQLKLRDGALETQQKPAVRGSRIVDAVAV